MNINFCMYGSHIFNNFIPIFLIKIKPLLILIRITYEQIAIAHAYLSIDLYTILALP